MQPIIEINDFSIWMIADETINTPWAFYRLDWIDVKSEPWVAQAALQLDSTIANVFPSTNSNLKLKNFFPWDTTTDNWNVLFYKTTWIDTILVSWRKRVVEWYSFFSSYIIPIWIKVEPWREKEPYYSEIIYFQNHLFVPDWFWNVQAIFLYNSIRWSASVAGNLLTFNIWNWLNESPIPYYTTITTWFWVILQDSLHNYQYLNAVSLSIIWTIWTITLSTPYSWPAFSNRKFAIYSLPTFFSTPVSWTLSYRGTYNASNSTYPTTGGSGTAWAILKWDYWTINVAGALGWAAIQIWYTIIANVDTPGQISTNWKTTLNTSLPMVNWTQLYRPFCEFNRQLYIWDWNLVYNLDDKLSDFNTAYALDIWKNYTIKQIINMWWAMWILADENVVDDYWQPRNPDNNFSTLFIWNWKPWTVKQDAAISQFAPIWSHCWWIYYFNSNLFALSSAKDTFWWDWDVNFCNYNWSNFEVRKKIRIVKNPWEITYLWIDSLAFFQWRIVIWVWWTWTDRWLWDMQKFDEDPYSLTKVWTYDWITWVWILEEAESNQIVIADSTWIRRIWTTKFVTSNIQTLKYQLNMSQWNVLLKWVQIDFKYTIPTWCSCEVQYAKDEATTFTSLWTLTSTNQNQVLFWTIWRCSKISLKMILTSTWTYSAKIMRIRLY